MPKDDKDIEILDGINDEIVDINDDQDIYDDVDDSDYTDNSTADRIQEASSKGQNNTNNNQNTSTQISNATNKNTNIPQTNTQTTNNQEDNTDPNKRQNIGDKISDAGKNLKEKGENISENAQKKQARAQKLEKAGQKLEQATGGKFGGKLQNYAQKKEEKAKKQEELGEKIQNAGDKIDEKGNAISQKLDNLNPVNKAKKAVQTSAENIKTAAKIATKFALKKILAFIAPFLLPIFAVLFMAFLIVLLIYGFFFQEGVTDNGPIGAEFYSNICYGNISKVLVDELSTPVEIRNNISGFEGEAGFGIANGKKHNGVDLNEKTTGNVEGDVVKSVADGTVTKSTFDNTYTGSARKGGWLEIEYNVSTDNGEFKFDIIYGGLNPSSLTLKKGDTVTKEQEIGKIGGITDTDNDVPTLYFSYYDISSRTYLDPTNVFVPCVNYNGLAGSYNIEGYPNATKIVNAIIAEPGIDEKIKDEMHLAAILANVNVESVGSALSDPDSHSVEGGSGIGIGFIQWSFTRNTGLKNYAAHVGSTWKDPDIQAKYLAAEHVQGGGADGYASFQFLNMNRYYNVNYATYDGFLNATTGETATEAYCYSFARPDKDKAHVDRRRTLYSQWKELLEKSRVISADSGLNAINGAINDRVSRIIAAGGGGTTGTLQSPFDTDGTVNKVAAAASGYTFDGGGKCGSGKTVNRSMGGYGCSFHGGNDYSASYGTPVYAVDGGHVDTVTNGGGMGLYISVSCTYGGKTYTIVYQHLSDALVSPGDNISKGQLIAKTGDSGSPGSYHLHLEIIKGPITYKIPTDTAAPYRNPSYRVNPYDYIVGSKRGQNYFND